MMTRMLEYTPSDGGPPRTITITVGAAERDPDPAGDWRALLTIAGFDGEPFTKHVHGVDGFQAVLGAA